MDCARVMRGMNSMVKSEAFGSRQRLETGAVAVGIEHGDDERAGLQGFHLIGARAAHLEEDVGVAQRVGRRRHDLGALGTQHIVGKARAQTGARLDLHMSAEPDELLGRLGRDRDARFVRPLRRYSYGDHELFQLSGGLSVDCPARRHGRFA